MDDLEKRISKTDLLKDIAVGTLDWYTFFQFGGVKRKLFGSHYQLDIDIKRMISLESWYEPFFSGKSSKLFDSMSRLDFLGSMERFWSYWNPFVNRVTKKVYRLLGGNDRKISATLGTFAYSALFMHAFHPVVLAVAAYSEVTDSEFGFFDVPLAVTAAYVAMGVPVALKKVIGGYERQKEEYTKVDKLKAGITGALMAGYSAGAFFASFRLVDAIT